MHLQPVTTERSNPRGLRADRLAAIAVSAAEQCGRLTVPALDDRIAFASLLDTAPKRRPLFLADETGAGNLITQISLPEMAQGWALMIGPEGGFSDEELDLARRTPNLTSIDLGPRVLRADTAAVAGLAVLQSHLGDWRHSAGSQ